jgi:hypothetical protein
MCNQRGFKLYVSHIANLAKSKLSTTILGRTDVYLNVVGHLHSTTQMGTAIKHLGN